MFELQRKVGHSEGRDEEECEGGGEPAQDPPLRVFGGEREVEVRREWLQYFFTWLRTNVAETSPIWIEYALTV